MSKLVCWFKLFSTIHCIKTSLTLSRGVWLGWIIIMIKITQHYRMIDHTQGTCRVMNGCEYTYGSRIHVASVQGVHCSRQIFFFFFFFLCGNLVTLKWQYFELNSAHVYSFLQRRVSKDYVNHSTKKKKQHYRYAVRPMKTQISLRIRPDWWVFTIRMKKLWLFVYP